MEKHYTVFFQFLFIASISGGMAFKNHFDFSMIIGVGLATIFLFASAYSLAKKNRKRSSHN